ncbi:hypothetical protein CsSME_00026551 [Camellia sinensis var. sinensis]
MACEISSSNNTTATSSNFTQLLPYLRGQHLFQYIDGTLPCPPSTTTIDGTATTNPAHSVWKRQDQLILSLLIASLSEDILPLAVGCASSRALWLTLEQSLASPSHTRLLQLRLGLQQLKQNNRPATVYLQEAKSFADELTAAGAPLSSVEFNLYVFQGIHSDFKDLVTTLTARSDPVSFSELHSLLLSHEFLHRRDTTPPAFITAPQVNFTQTTSRGQFHGGSIRGGRGRGRTRDRSFSFLWFWLFRGCSSPVSWLRLVS